MKTNKKPPRWLRAIAAKVLPRGVRASHMDALNELDVSRVEWLRQWGALAAASYRTQIMHAFNASAFLAVGGSVVYCFAAASLSLPLFVLLGVVLCTLTLHDAFIHRAHGPRKTTSQYHLDSFGGSVTAAVAILATEALLQHVSPSLALPAQLFIRGALVCLPLTLCLRIVLQPRPDEKTPVKDPKMSADQIYWATWRLNFLWMTPYAILILYNQLPLPQFLPERENVSEMIQAMTFVIWFRLQQDSLTRRDMIETMAEKWVRKMKLRKKETLIKGIDMGKRVPVWYRALQALIFLELATPSAVALWPWLSGGHTHVDFVRLAFGMVTFTTLLLTWNSLKRANQAAARALQGEIDEEEAA
jgi:hypothetical protein